MGKRIANRGLSRRESGFAAVLTLVFSVAAVVALSVGISLLARVPADAARPAEPSTAARSAASSTWRQAGLPVQAQGTVVTGGSSAIAREDEQGEDAGNSPDPSEGSDSAASRDGEPSDGAPSDASSNAAATTTNPGSRDAADSTADSASESTGDPAASATVVLEKAIADDAGKHYTVRVEYAPDSGIPEGAELSVAWVMLTPEGYDPKKPEFKDRPTEEERFVSADQLAERAAELAKALDVREGDETFYTAFLDISLKADGKAAKLAEGAKVKVTVETDAVKADDAKHLRASFFTEKKPGAEHAEALNVQDRSADPAKDKKYEKGAKVAFETDKLSELGLMGVVTAEELEAARAEAESESAQGLDDAAIDGESASADGTAEAESGSGEEVVQLGLAAFPVAANNGASSGPSLANAVAQVRLANVMVAADLRPAALITATWVDDDATVLDSDSNASSSAADGFRPEYKGETPNKAADAQYTYTFAGWKSSLDASDSKTTFPAGTTTFPEVIENVVYTAVYDATVNTYTIKWVNYDGSELEIDENVEYGTTPTYDGATPTRPEAQGTQYSFSYWNPNPEPVTGDATYTAVYTEAPVEFVIQDYSSRQPFAGAALELKNNSSGVTVWTGTTTANGVLSIPRVDAEKPVSEGGNGATFANDSSYTLTQTATDGAHYKPEGSWTLAVDSAGKFSCAVHPASASDLTTRAASGPYGIRFYLFNVASSTITYNYNYPAGVSGQPADVTMPLSDLGYGVSYAVDVDDPILAGYEFVGWVVDGTSRTAKHGASISLDTVNVRSHTMTACWRNPLKVVAKTYFDGDSSRASTLSYSAGAYQVVEEKSIAFADLAAVCSAYGAQNESVGTLNANASYAFAFAQVVNGAEQTRIAALQYDAGAHAWQYKASADAAWTNIAQGDVLELYYASELVSVQWVMQADNGSFTALDAARFPASSAVVSDSWVGVEDLIAAADRPVVYGLGYFRSFGIGASGASQAVDLDKSELSSFSLKNSENGFLFRADAASEGELLQNSTIYVVYSKTPPDGSTYLDIENHTGWSYRVDGLMVGGAATADDLLAQGKVVVLGENTLQVMAPEDTVVTGDTVQLVLLGTGASQPFVLDGGLEESAEAGTVVSAAVANSTGITRTALVKDAGSDPLANTSAVTRGTLEAAPGKVVVSLDSNLFDLTVKKAWSDDSYPQHYQVDFALYEDDLRCVTGTAAASGYYVVSPDEGDYGAWTVVVPNLPARCAYSVTEQAVREVSGSRTVADRTGDFTPSYSSSDDGHEITVRNTRSSAVCQVGGQQFTTIKAAVDYIVANEMKTDATIEMLRDYIMAESGSVTIPEGYDIALTTAGGESAKTVTRGFTGAADLFCVKGSLAITNLTLAGKLDNAWLAKDGNGGLVVVDGANAKLTAGMGSVFTNGKADNGAAIYAQNGATVKLDGARITDNRSVSGGAVGVADAACRIQLTGDTYVYGNRNGNGGGNFDIYLNQDSNEIIQVVDGGLGSSSSVQIGVYVPGDGSASSLYSGHGAPAKPFATYDSATKGNLENANLSKLVNDRISSPKSNFGSASAILDDTVVWGETFSFTAKKQWLDASFNVQDAPADATSTLTLSGGSTTLESAKAPVTLDGAADDIEKTPWTYVFTGLAKYDSEGKACAYKLKESGIPADYKQVVFTGDKATEDNPLTYDENKGGQTVIVSNYYRYTTLTVNKTVLPADQGLRSTFEVYGVPKDGSDLTGSIRKGGVGSVNDLPNALRGSVADLDSITEDGLFHTEEGGNNWYTKIDGETIKFHAFYDAPFYEISGDASGRIVIGGVTPQKGDVAHPGSSGFCSIYDGASWHTMAKSITTSYIDFSRQDGDEGVEGVGGTDMGKSCTIEGSGTHTFTLDDKLPSDYYYYVVETSVQETNGQNRSIPASHKLVATYNPKYSYDQLNQTVSVTNTRRDFLSVDKIWPEDATNLDDCVFDVYEITDGDTVEYLSDAAKFAELVKSTAGSAAWGTKIAEFTLDEKDAECRGSWVHVLEKDNLTWVDESQKADLDLTQKVYFVRERTAGGVAIANPDVNDSSTAVDAVYEYDAAINQITVRNMSDVLCKVVDGDGTEHPFRTLNDALTYGRTRTNGDSNTTFAIEMLRDYSIPASDIMTLAVGENITLTTAATAGGAYNYRNADGAVTRATITRKAGNTWSFFRVNGDASDVAATSLTLENIALDGANIAVNYKTGGVDYYSGGFVYAKNATVELKKAGNPAAGVEMRNALANNGGAIYADKSNVNVSNAVFKACQSTDAGNSDRGGGAIWTSGARTAVADSAFTDCSAKRYGGAVFAYGNAAGSVTAITGTTFTTCTASQDGGAVYSRNYTLNIGGAREGDACAFMGCTAVYRAGGAYHESTSVGSVTNVAGCTFVNCRVTGGDSGNYTRYGGGGLNSGADIMNVTDTVFDHCYSYSRGGGLIHFNVNASENHLTRCTFNACTSVVSGGGGAHLTGIVQTIDECSFVDCIAERSAGGGLDIGCFDKEKTAAVADTTFKRCTAGNANGGGICFGGTWLTATRCTFDTCVATTQNGGGIAVSAGGTMRELGLYGCTFTACRAPANYGGAVHTQTLATIIADDPDDPARHTTFTECSSWRNGGAVYEDRNAEGTSVIATNASFSNCKSAGEQGGGLRVNATTLGLTNTTFDQCEAASHGGSVYQGIYGNYINASSATATNCSFANSTSGDWGGAIYTEAKALVVQGSPSQVTFDACTAKNPGGAVAHNRSNYEGATATFTTCRFNECRSTNSSGGAVFTYAQATELTDDSFTACTSWNRGGAVNQSVSWYIDPSSLKVENCSFDTVTSEGDWGGGIYTSALKVDIAKSSFSNAASYYPGGAVYHERGWEKAQTDISECSFDHCVSTASYGGAVRSTATKLTATGSLFYDCSGTSDGALSHGVNNDYAGSSETTVTNCSFEKCEARTDNNGALYSNALKLTVTGSLNDATFKDCTAYQNAGAVRHSRDWRDAKTTLNQVSFENCTAANQSAGAVWSQATKMALKDSSWLNCTARSTAGAVYQGVNGDYVADSQAEIEGCTFDTCQSTNASSGAVYTNALELSITGKPDATTFANCTARNNGGAVYHERNWKAAKTSLAGVSFSKCETTTANGGAITSSATKFSAADVSCVDCTARATGGAVYHVINYDNLASTEMLVSHGTFENCKATVGNAGAVYTQALSIEVNGGSDGARTTFLNCSSAYDGGAFYQNRNEVGSKVKLADCDFNICTTTYVDGNNRGGGAYVRARDVLVDGCTFDTCIAKGNGGCLAVYPETDGVHTATITNSSFTGGVSQTGNGGAIYAARTDVVLVNSLLADSTANRGGGLYFDDWERRSVTIDGGLDGSSVAGNTANTFGGGVYFVSDGNLTLRNGASITGNKLGTNTVDSAAGVYLSRDRGGATLVLGSEGSENDTITVYDNTTAAGAQSNVRLVHSWTRDNKTNRYYDREDSVSLLSNLVKSGVGSRGLVGVCNPGPENTRFGVGNVGNHTGTEYIMSDIDTLVGKIDPSDLEGKRIIWYAPPVCKITDAFGRILTYDVDKTAAFSSLAAAYEVANNLTPGYIVDDQNVTPSQIQIQMLVADYPLESSMPALQRDITLTTAEKGAGEFDYPENAASEWCTIRRTAGVTGSMFAAASGKTMTVAKLTLDGGNAESSPIVADVDGGIIYGQVNSAIVLSENAVLQNAAVGSNNRGGAVFVTGGSDDSVPALVMERNATILNCSAGDGGGVYLTGGVLFRMNDAPHIEGCSASGAGGAVYVSPYATMSFYENPNGVIRGNCVTSADGEGAGIYLPSNDSKLLLKLGASADISGNYVAGSQDDSRLNGGDPYPLLYQDIYLGESAEPVTSITLVDNISQPEGAISVWARDAVHYKTEMQFAVVATDASGNPAFTLLESSLAAFRNARDDADTENDTDTYLYGLTEDGVNVVWSYNTGSAKVILRKVADAGGSYDSLSGAVFTVYKGRSSRPYVVRHDDGTRETLSGLRSGEAGVFWIGNLPYGTYYLEETTTPSGYDASRKWFRLDIDETGVRMSSAATSRAAL